MCFADRKPQGAQRPLPPSPDCRICQGYGFVTVPDRPMDFAPTFTTLPCPNCYPPEPMPTWARLAVALVFFLLIAFLIWC